MGRERTGNKGIFDAMNKGLARAAGAFVLFLNAGDSFANVDVLSRVSKILSSNTIDFLYGDSVWRPSPGDRLSYKVAQGHDRPALRNVCLPTSRCTTRRSLIGDQRYDPAISHCRRLLLHGAVFF